MTSTTEWSFGPIATIFPLLWNALWTLPALGGLFLLALLASLVWYRFGRRLTPARRRRGASSKAGFEVINAGEAPRFIPLEEQEHLAFLKEIQALAHLRLSSNLERVLLQVEDGQHVIEDHNSRQAVLINRRLTRKVTLKEGDVLDLGELTLIYRAAGSYSSGGYSSGGYSSDGFSAEAHLTTQREHLSPAAERQAARRGKEASPTVSSTKTVDSSRVVFQPLDLDAEDSRPVKKKIAEDVFFSQGSPQQDGASRDGSSRGRPARGSGSNLEGAPALISWDAPHTPYVLTQNVIFIGRSWQCDLILRGARVSYRQARLERVGERFRLTNLASLGSTCVNERRIEQRYLRPGDTISFEDHRFRFEMVQGGEAQANGERRRPQTGTSAPRTSAPRTSSPRTPSPRPPSQSDDLPRRKVEGPRRHPESRPQPAHPQPARPQPARSQPARPQSARPQPVRPQSARPQPARPQPARSQPARPQSARPQPARPQPARPQPVRPQSAHQQSDDANGMLYDSTTPTNLNPAGVSASVSEEPRPRRHASSRRPPSQEAGRGSSSTRPRDATPKTSPRGRPSRSAPGRRTRSGGSSSAKPRGSL